MKKNKERRKKHWAEEIGIKWMDGMPLTLEQISYIYDITRESARIYESVGLRQSQILAGTIPEVEIKTKIEEDIDPMAALDRLTPEYQEKVVEQSKIDLKDAIASVRKCIEDLGERGMYINVEEIDFDSVYQITIQIHKDN